MRGREHEVARDRRAVQEPRGPASITTACANFGAGCAPPTMAAAGQHKDRTMREATARVIAA